MSTTKDPGAPASRTRTRAERARAKAEAPDGKPSAKPDLKVVEAQVFRGPNYWSYDPCIRLLVDLGTLEHWPSNTLPGFNDGLLEVLPGLKDHSCSLGRAGGFIDRLTDGTWAGHVAEHVALELQRQTGAQIYRGKTRSAPASTASARTAWTTAATNPRPTPLGACGRRRATSFAT